MKLKRRADLLSLRARCVESGAAYLTTELHMEARQIKTLASELEDFGVAKFDPSSRRQH